MKINKKISSHHVNRVKVVMIEKEKFKHIVDKYKNDNFLIAINKFIQKYIALNVKDYDRYYYFHINKDVNFCVSDGNIYVRLWKTDQYYIDKEGYDRWKK